MTYKIADQNQDRAFTGKHMLAIIIGFFGVIIAVNLTLAYFALQSWSGLVVKNSYVASQKFNQTLKSAALQNARKWRSDLTLEKDVLDFEIATKENRPVTGFIFTAYLQRPATERDDYEISLKEVLPGHYRARFQPRPGNWTISIRGQDASGLRYRQDYEADMTSLLILSGRNPGQ